MLIFQFLKARTEQKNKKGVKYPLVHFDCAYYTDTKYLVDPRSTHTILYIYMYTNMHYSKHKHLSNEGKHITYLKATILR